MDLSASQYARQDPAINMADTLIQRAAERDRALTAMVDAIAQESAKPTLMEK